MEHVMYKTCHRLHVHGNVLGGRVAIKRNIKQYKWGKIPFMFWWEVYQARVTKMAWSLEIGESF
jgi:hypothetical protein